jgi:hypothetical protein
MSMRRAHRIGAAGGFGYTIFTFAAWLCLERLGSGGPVTNWSAHHLTTFFVEHRTIERLSAMFFSLAILPYIVFLGHLRVVLTTPEDGDPEVRTVSSVLRVALVAGAVIPFTISLFLWGAAYQPTVASASVTQLSYDLLLLTAPAGAVTIWAAMLGAGAYLILRRGVLPRWLGIFAAVSFCLQFLYFGNGFTTHGFFDGQTPLNSWDEGLSAIFAYGSYLIWILCVSVVWVRGWEPARREALKRDLESISAAPTPVG